MEDESGEEEVYSEEEDDDEDEIVQGIRVQHIFGLILILLNFVILFLPPRIIRLVGMENPFHIGFTNCMVWALNINVKYVAMRHIWAVVITKGTFRFVTIFNVTRACFFILSLGVQAYSGVEMLGHQ